MIRNTASQGLANLVASLCKTSSEKPRELVIAEDIRRLAQQGDLTSGSIRYQQAIAPREQPGRSGADTIGTEVGELASGHRVR